MRDSAGFGFACPSDLGISEPFLRFSCEPNSKNIFAGVWLRAWHEAEFLASVPLDVVTKTNTVGSYTCGDGTHASLPGDKPVTTDEWLKAKRIFKEALTLPPGDRDAFVAGACDDDSAVRAEVEAMLRADHDAPENFIEPPQA